MWNPPPLRWCHYPMYPTLISILFANSAYFHTNKNNCYRKHSWHFTPEHRYSISGLFFSSITHFIQNHIVFIWYSFSIIFDLQLVPAIVANYSNHRFNWSYKSFIIDAFTIDVSSKFQHAINPNSINLPFCNQNFDCGQNILVAYVTCHFSSGFQRQYSSR